MVLPTAKETRIGPRNYQSVHWFPIYFSSEGDSFAEGQGRDLPTRFRSKLTIISKNQIGIRNPGQGRNQSVMVLLARQSTNRKQHWFVWRNTPLRTQIRYLNLLHVFHSVADIA